MASGTLFTYGTTNVDSLLATTLSAIRKTLQDAIFQKIPLFMWLDSKQRLSQAGGASIITPLMFGKNTTAGAYSGYGTLDTTPQEGITAAQWRWKQYFTSISISGSEEMQNAGENGLIRLLEAKVKQAELSLRDRLGIDAWAATQVSSRLEALPVVVATANSVADISQTANSWWQAQVTASGSFAAQGLSDMRLLFNNIAKQSLSGGAPDYLCGTQSVYEFYEGSLQPQQRFSDSKMASAGFQNVNYKGATFTWDPNVPSGNLFMLSSDALSLVVHSQRNFVTTPFVKPSNQDARVAQILWMGNVVCDNIRRLGKLTGLTA